MKESEKRALQVVGLVGGGGERGVTEAAVGKNCYSL